MKGVLNALRGVMNMTGSGVLLLLATCVLVYATNVPDSAFAGSSWGSAIVTLGAALFSGLLTISFWTQRAGRPSYHASAILNGLATVAFLAIVAVWWINR